MSEAPRDLAEHAQQFRDGRASHLPGTLPAHWATCFGCGQDSEAGLKVVCRRVGEEIHATYAFSERHAGAPGIAHGGTVAALLDDVSGFILFVIGEAAVTRKLEVEYLTPVLVGVEYGVVARLERREGRKLFVVSEGRNPEGALVFRGSALFLVVDLSHFANAAEGSTPPVAL